MNCEDCNLCEMVESKFSVSPYCHFFDKYTDNTICEFFDGKEKNFIN